MVIGDNITAEVKGGKLHLVCDIGRTIAEAGTKTSTGQARKNDLVATSRGFRQLTDGLSISLNVNRLPQAATE